MTSRVTIQVLKPGWFTTVQDLGRHGYQQYGVPVCGAMDRHSLIVANRLVGNHDGAAALELTLKGPELRVEREAVVAMTGANLSPTLNGRTVPLWTSLLVPAGSRLAFGVRRAGMRSYLALAGGIDVPVVLGSRSTHVSSRMGGFQGRPLAAGDRLSTGVPSRHRAVMIGRSAPDSLCLRDTHAVVLRAVPGPHVRSFAEDALEKLTAHSYRISSRSDRVGYRLEGPGLAQPVSEEWISDGTAMGALQVPQDGQAILLMADRQTTGGYPILAVVISADLRLAAQVMPGEAITFRMTTVSEAQALMKAQWKNLDEKLRAIRSASRANRFE